MRRRRPAEGRDELTDQDRKRLGDPVPRQLYQTGGSLVVAVPTHVVEYLDARRGQSLWWWLGAGREAIVSMTPRRVGGRPGGLHAARELTAARAEITKLRRRLGARPEAVYNEGVNEGRMRHVGELVTLGEKIDELSKRVEALAASIPFRRRRARGPEQRPPTRPESSRPVEAVHLPEPSATPEPEHDPPFADDFDSHGRVVPRAASHDPDTDRGDTEIALPS